MTYHIESQRAASLHRLHLRLVAPTTRLSLDISMTTPSLKGLTADFRSFYRLFRRTCSASVLHRNAQAVALRNLYRPTFRRAGLVYMHIKNSTTKDSPGTEKQKAWVDIWNQRSAYPVLAELNTHMPTNRMYL